MEVTGAEVDALTETTVEPSPLNIIFILGESKAPLGPVSLEYYFSTTRRKQSPVPVSTITLAILGHR
jgi:hypothetical protein